jgi:aryl-alcohol dehydrogenase-like predicted oxidoreductase
VLFSPAGQGFLTGKSDESTRLDCTAVRDTVPRCAAENRPANQAFVDRRGTSAARKPVPSAPVARVVVDPEVMDRAIPGTPEPHRRNENVGAAAIELTTDALRALEDAASPTRAPGEDTPRRPRR